MIHTRFLLLYYISIPYRADTPSNCKMLSMLLRGRNIESDIVENGRLAVQAVACKGPYDFIFMDFTMPIMVSTVHICTCKFDLFFILNFSDNYFDFYGAEFMYFLFIF